MAENVFLEQSKQFYKKLTGLQKIIIASAFVMVAGFVIFLVTSKTEPEQGVLFNSLDENDASQIVNKLKEKQIKYNLKDNGSTILVDKNQVYETRITLAGEGLPQTSVVGYEIFDKTNLGMSEFVQKLNYRRALEGELVKTINTLEEVKKSRVHIVIPDKTLFQKDQKIPTASVSLRLKTGKALAKTSIEGIQRLVASSVEGLQPENVTILDQKGKIINDASPDDKSVAGMTSSQYEQQKKVEQYLTGKVQTLLDGVIGQGNSEIRVNAELDFTQVEKTTTDFDPERQVVRSEQTVTHSNKNNDSLNIKRTNTRDTNSNANYVVGYPAQNSTDEQSSVISNYEIKKTVETIVNGVGSLKRLTIAALINGKPPKYLPRDSNEIQKLEQIIKNAVGYNPQRNDEVYVQSVTFDTNVLEEEPNLVFKGPWWQNPDYQKILLLVAAMLITIYVMYRILQSKQVKERMRIAFSLPSKINIEDDEEEKQEMMEEELEELDLGDDELLLLPADLPEQLLLEAEKEEKYSTEIEGGTEMGFDKASLSAQARAKLDEIDVEEMTEDRLMKIELKQKVGHFLDTQTEEGVKLVRMLLSQDAEEKLYKNK